MIPILHRNLKLEVVDNVVLDCLPHASAFVTVHVRSREFIVKIGDILCPTFFFGEVCVLSIIILGSSISGKISYHPLLTVA